MSLLRSTAAVPWQRAIREHRLALAALGVVLAINVIVLLAVVLPLAQRVAANERRAEQAAGAEQVASAEYRTAEAVRDGKAQATKDLETFYREVLPSDVAAARRILQSKILAIAQEHDIAYERGASNTESVRDSALERLMYSLTLTGDYDDIRAMIYDLETAPEFIVIDNIVLTEGQNPNAALSWALQLSTYYRTAADMAGTNGR